MKYSTSNGTAVAGIDYTAISPPVTMTFNNGVISNAFKVTVMNNGIIYTNPMEKTVYLCPSAGRWPATQRMEYRTPCSASSTPITRVI